MGDCKLTKYTKVDTFFSIHNSNKTNWKKKRFKNKNTKVNDIQCVYACPLLIECYLVFKNIQSDFHEE